MTLPTDPAAFVADWLEAWNDHDLDRLLAHFDPAVRFTSPVAARVFPETGGVLEGSDALRRYWTRGRGARLTPVDGCVAAGARPN